MALDWEATKQLMRLLATAEEIAAAAKSAGERASTVRRNAAGRQLDALIEQVKQLLQAADPKLAEEFEAVAGTRGSTAAVEAQAVAVYGWIKGATDAEAFERKVMAEAEAYAQERIRKERPTGFSAP